MSFKREIRKQNQLVNEQTHMKEDGFYTVWKVKMVKGEAKEKKIKNLSHFLFLFFFKDKSLDITSKFFNCPLKVMDSNCKIIFACSVVHLTFPEPK